MTAWYDTDPQEWTGQEAQSAWARVELHGLRVLHGRVCRGSLLGEPMLRIESFDVDAPTRAPKLEFYSFSAVYGITPLSEAEAEPFVSGLAMNVWLASVRLSRSAGSAADG